MIRYSEFKENYLMTSKKLALRGMFQEQLLNLIFVFHLDQGFIKNIFCKTNLGLSPFFILYVIIVSLILKSKLHTVPTTPVLTNHSKERRFVYSNHLSKEFLEQMIPHLKALI